jgi:hypothetical protein
MSLLPTGSTLIFHPTLPPKAPKSFSHNLLNILKVRLVIQPTTSFHEHLLIIDNVIKIFKTDIPTLFGLGAYNKNKVAA